MISSPYRVSMSYHTGCSPASVSGTMKATSSSGVSVCIRVASLNLTTIFFYIGWTSTTIASIKTVMHTGTLTHIYTCTHTMCEGV